MTSTLKTRLPPCTTTGLHLSDMAEPSADLVKLTKQLQTIIKKSKPLRKRIANMAVARIGARSVQDFMRKSVV